MHLIHSKCLWTEFVLNNVIKWIVSIHKKNYFCCRNICWQPLVVVLLCLILCPTLSSVGSWKLTTPRSLSWPLSVMGKGLIVLKILPKSIREHIFSRSLADLCLWCSSVKQKSIESEKVISELPHRKYFLNTKSCEVHCCHFY